MIRAKIIDIIKSAFAGVLRIDNLAEYKESYVAADMTDNALVPYGLMQAAIAAGGIPSTYVADIPAESPMPDGYIEIEYTSGLRTLFGDNPSMEVDIVYDANNAEQVFIGVKKVYVSDILSFIRISFAPNEAGNTPEHYQFIITASSTQGVGPGDGLPYTLPFTL